MPKFLVRVELVDVPDESRELYESLHKAMSEQDFERTIAGARGRWKLPAATYLGNFNLESPDVRDRAAQAVRSIGQRAQIFVVQYTNAAWTGLESAS
jgi:hypothetical protein